MRKRLASPGTHADVRAALPTIPVIDANASDDPALTAVQAEPERADLLLGVARKTYTAPGLWIADGLTRRWVRRANPPYTEAVAAVDRQLGRRGAFLLNHSYEWGCTTGALNDSEGVTLARTLDWPLAELGRALVVTRWQADAGQVISVTWPGYVGILTGLAPNRFAAAINQPPLPLPSAGAALGWIWTRFRTAGSTGLPPTHLLRRVFETCRDYTSAVAMIRDTPICIPAIFTIAGIRPGEAIVIERTRTSAFVPAEPVAANHWASADGPAGKPRNRSSHDRRSAMAAMLSAPPAWSLDWLSPPILMRDTRVAVMANAATGRLLAQGFEAEGPATQALSLG